jgi:hypothetical protein
MNILIIGNHAINFDNVARVEREYNENKKEYDTVIIEFINNVRLPFTGSDANWIWDWVINRENRL